LQLILILDDDTNTNFINASKNIIKIKPLNKYDGARMLKCLDKEEEIF